jgi:predicted alpha/beta hydrolase family esterase
VATTKRILVAHSYGGAVITDAGTDPSVVGLVYVAAHMPDAGENEADNGKRFPFKLTQLVVLALFVVLTFVAAIRFRPEPLPVQ